jgi:hypothetical protein
MRRFGASEARLTVKHGVVTLRSGDRQRLLAEGVNAVLNALTCTAKCAHEVATAAESSPGSQLGGEEAPRALLSPSCALRAGPSDSAPPSALRRMVPHDVAALLVRSLADGDRGRMTRAPAPPSSDPGGQLRH